jgi:signal transduction histidine kinase
LNGLIMRSVYALVAAVMLGYFASYRDRSRSRLARLAAWPIEANADENDPWLEGSLRHASEVLGGLRLLVIWNDAEEPNGRIAYWDGDRCSLRDFSADTLALLGNSQSARFYNEPFADAVGLPDVISRQLGFYAIQTARGKPVCCSAPFATQRYWGRVFVIDPGHPTDDMLSLTGIVAGRIAFELEQFALMRELASAAGWRERGRLARDLHDSVLQDLTAAGLQLKIASQQNHKTMQASLGLIGKMLQDQQRRIRSFVENAQPKSDNEPQFLKERLEAFSLALSSQWSCSLSIEVNPADMRVRDSILAAICQMVSEATANAARHGQADRIDVSIKAASVGLAISISDNGVGIAGVKPKSEIGPQSIQARVADLGGEFQLDPSAPGLVMRILLPL